MQLGIFFHRWDVEASYHHLLVATYRIDPILRCEHHDAIREKERICWKRERGGAHFDYTSGRDIFRYTPKLAWKRNPHSFWRAYYTFTWTRVIFKNANHKKNPPNSHNAMHQCGHYSFYCQKMRASQGLDNGIVMEDISRYFSTKKWRNRLSRQILKFWIDLQSLIVYQASYRLNLGKPKSNSHWSMLLHLTCFINLLISIWKNYPFYWSQKILPTVI